MFPIIYVALLMGSLPSLAYSWAPNTNDTRLHANKTASYKDSWLGWVSISRGLHSFLVTLGCKAYFGSIELNLRPSSPFEHVLLTSRHGWKGLCSLQILP